jgi:sugar phosphate permease
MGAPHRLRYFREALILRKRSDVLGTKNASMMVCRGDRMTALTGTPVDARSSAARAFAALGIAIIVGSYVVNAMDRTLFPLLLPEVRREYGFDLPAAGLMSTVFTIGMALAGLPTGYLMSRYARKSVAQIGMFIFSAATIVTVFAAGFTDMLTYRALTGIGEAMQLTALLAIVSSYFRAIALLALVRSTARSVSAPCSARSWAPRCCPPTDHGAHR